MANADNLANATESSETRTLRGRVVLWERPACSEFGNCELPQELGIDWDIDATLIRPQDLPGALTHWSSEWRAQGWLLRLLFVWKAASPPNPAHIITQAMLFRSEFGLVAECSRYDSPEDFFPFAPGSCAGQLGAKQVGVSFLRR